MSALRRHWNRRLRRYYYTATFARFVARFEHDDEARGWVATIRSRDTGFTEFTFARDLFTQRSFNTLETLHAHVIEWVNERPQELPA